MGLSADGDPPRRTFRGTVSYEGTDFAGWQVQPGRRTVQATVEDALAGVLGERVPVLAAGRTDAGVHALGQALSFRAATAIPPRGILAAVNAALPEDVALLSLDHAPDDFHATRDALRKIYRYEVQVSRLRDPLRRRTAHRVPGLKSAAAMGRAAAVLVGTRDFRSFRTNPGPERKDETTVRTLFRAEVRRRGDTVLFEFEGDGFLHHMVRNLVGTLLQVGRGAWQEERVGEALAARDRSAAGPTAPARGLTMVAVLYPGDDPRTGPFRRSFSPVPPRRS